MISGLDHVQIAAPEGCEMAARTFYGGVLGLAEIDKPPRLAARGGVWFGLGDGRQLHVGAVPRREFAPALKAHPALRVSSAEALRALASRLSDDGHPVIWPDPEEIPGLRRFYVADPWGNRLELLAG